jgi:hypothetical protein
VIPLAWDGGTPAGRQAIYPGSFSVIYVPDGPVDKDRLALVSAVKSGDILMFRSRFADSFNQKVQAIYRDAEW